MDEQNNILYQAATVWKRLTEFNYVFTYGYKKQLHTIHLTFSMYEFPHLAGFQYLKDISFPRCNASKVVDRILEHKITYEQICKGVQYVEMVQPRLEAIARLDKTLETDFQLFFYTPKLYPFVTSIQANYLISSSLDKVSFVFIIQSSGEDSAKRDYLCCSAFIKGQRNYEANQRKRTLLKKERVHIETNTSTVLYDRIQKDFLDVKELDKLVKKAISDSNNMGFSGQFIYLDLDTNNPITIYAKRALRDRKIPFEIVAPKEPFYSKENTESIKESVQQIREGKIVQKTMDELEAMERE